MAERCIVHNFDKTTRAINIGHRKGENTRSFCVYTVYDNRTDFPVIVDGEARDCAKAMGLCLAGFYCAVTRARKGQVKKWTIIQTYIDRIKENDNG